MKRYDKALADFDKAISIDPRVANAYYGIACLYSLMKKLDQAFKHLNKAIDCGFRNWGWMRKDEDLKNLHQDPRWKKALARQQEEKKESR